MLSPLFAQNPPVNIDGSISGDVYGNSNDSGVTASLPSNNSTLNINENGGVSGSAFGGYDNKSVTVNNASALNNTVNINNGGSVSENVSGGHALSGHVLDDFGSATSTNNIVNIHNNSSVNENVHGGFAQSTYGSANASHNSVNIGNESTVGQNIYGGRAESTSGTVAASNNRVNINSGSITGDVHGGYTQNANNAIASYNTVNISGSSTITGIVAGGFVLNTSSLDTVTATAEGNIVNITRSTVNNAVYGGHINITGEAAGTVKNNIVNVNNSTTGNIFGGNVVSSNGIANALNNIVNINGNSTISGITGGRAEGLISAAASGNTININGGTVIGNIYGGHASSASGTVSAVNNTVFLRGSPNLAGSIIYGGYAEIGGAPAGDAFSGNTLNVWYYNGSSIAGIQNFQNINFLIPVFQIGTVLNVTGTASLGDGSRGSAVTASTLGGMMPMMVGTKITLINAGDLDTNGFNQAVSIGTHGVLLRYLWVLSTDNNKLTATLGDVQVVPQAISLSEGYNSGLSLVTLSSDFVAGQGLTNAVNTAKENGFGIFTAIGSGWSRYNTSTHVDVYNVSFILGPSWGMNHNLGNMTFGAFLEGSIGSYATLNTFADGSSIRGKGSLYSIGGGVLGKIDFNGIGPGCFYTEFSLRFGLLANEYHTRDLKDILGRYVEYNSSSNYFGAHFGLGYIFSITDALSMTPYGRYSWAYLKGSSIALTTDDIVDFGGINSHRLHTGLRLNYSIRGFKPFIGLAYEHEFDGKINASTYGYKINSTSLNGSAGMGELGLSFNPVENLSMMLDVQGYLGNRQGVSGSFKVKWKF
jgi:hypothetical protein